MQHTLRTTVRALTASLAVGIVLLSLLPLPEPPVGEFALADKIGHAAAYLGLSFLLFVSRLPGPRARLALTAAGCSVLLGGLIELIQPLVQRNRELGDLVADVAGSTLGALLGLAADRWLRRALLRE